MKPHPFLRGIPAAAATAVISLTSPAFGQDGGLDGTFTPTVGVGGLPHTAVPQPDGSILVAGQFTSIARDATDPLSTRFRVARFENSGALDPDYSPNTNGIVWNVLVQPDSSVLVAGEFDRVNFTNNVLDPTTRVRHRVAKFDKTGAVDQFYSPALQNATSIFSLTAAAGGKVLIAGPPGYYMLDEEGVVVLQPSFYSYPLNAQNYAVYGIAMRPDQRFYAYGQFGNPAYTSYSVNSDYLELLGQNGRFPFPGPQGQDSNPFNITGGSVVAGAIHAAVVLPDGKVIIGGIFPAPPAPPPPPLPPGSPTPPPPPPSAPGLAKLDPVKGIDARYYSGRLDQAFYDVQKRDEDLRPFIDGNVHAIALQTDGKILIGGSFTKVRSPVKETNGSYRYDTHYGIARLMPDGSLDTTFDAKIQPVPGGNDSFVVRSIALQADGKVLITGTFQRIGASSTNYTYRPLIARLINNTSPATSVLTTDGNSITWMRGGSAPEATEVIFECLTPGNPDWALVDNLGIAGRIPGGWTRTLLTPLPPNTLVRASARTTGGRYNGSSGLVSATTGFQVARVNLQRDNPLAFIPNNGSTTFQNVGLGRPQDFAFTLTNVGDAGMADISVSISGTDASQFSIITPPPSALAVAAGAPIDIRFNPTSVGAKTATLEIESNDPAAPTFTVNLNGTAVTAIEAFRYGFFNTIANTGTAADDFDADGDGLTNFFEFVAGLNPTDKTSTFQQRVSIVAGKATMTFGPCLNDRTYQVVTNTGLAGGEWLPATGSTANNGTERIFTEGSVTNGKSFYRVKITSP